MNLYEHTIIARQDASPSDIQQLTEKYSKIVEKNDGEIIKTENWGLLNLSYLIKKNKKGSYIHFKIKCDGQVINELEKNESIDKKLLRYFTYLIPKNSQINIENFIKKSHQDKVHKLIIVTGKGLHSNNEKDPYVSKDLGILKYSIPEFLKNNSELMKMISNISDANIQDGGSGAFYIFLKKK